MFLRRHVLTVNIITSPFADLMPSRRSWRDSGAGERAVEPPYFLAGIHERRNRE